MVIVARFPGTCRKCGGRIAAGVEIEWAKGRGAEHVRCPSSAQRSLAAAAPKRERKPSPPTVEGEFAISRPSDGRHDGYPLGKCIYFGRVNGGCYGVIIEAGKNRNEDDEWECWARVRPATEEEIAPVRARREAAASKANDHARLDQIHEEIWRRQDGEQTISGRQIVIERQPMGPTSTLTVSGDTLYAVHPGYYDDWRASYGIVTDAALAKEVTTLADRLGL